MIPRAALLLLLSAASAHAQLSPEEGLKSFAHPDDLVVELVAAEPLISSPCAIAFDEHGRLFVAENRGYPNHADPPQGSIALLTDIDGDGKMDERVIFADGLTFPNGVLPWRGGVFVTCAPDVLYLKDTDGDGRADERRVVLTGFDTKGSTQLRVNAPTLGPDGWIYLAAGLSGGMISSPAHPERPPLKMTADVRFHPEKLEVEHVDGRSQYGMSFDDFGRRFICMNRIQVQHVVLSSGMLRRNPHLAFSETVQNCPELVPNPLLRGGGGAARIYPISANVTTADSHAGTFSAACAITIWRGGSLPQQYDGAAFSCDPTGNLVHVDKLEPRGATFAALPLLNQREFLASRDDWFRPVFLSSGPDGALYIADMYRKVIEHPDYLPEEMRERTDFNSGKETGRIWRVRKKDGSRIDAQLPADDAPDRVQQLASIVAKSSGWDAQTAFRLLAENRSGDNVRAIRTSFADDRTAAGHAALLHLLNNHRALEPMHVHVALHSGHAGVREVALTLAGEMPDWLEKEFFRFSKFSSDSSERVRFTFALALARVNSDEATNALAAIALNNGGDKWSTAAVLSSASGRVLPILRSMQMDSRPQSGMEEFYREAARIISASGEVKAGADLLRGLHLQSGNLHALLAGYSRGMQRRWTMEEVRAIEEREDAPAFSQKPFRAAAERIHHLIGPGAAPADAPLPGGPLYAGELLTLKSAIELMERSPWEVAREPLLAILNSPGAAELHEAAARALASFDQPEIVTTIIGNWRTWTPALRAAAVSSLIAQQAHWRGMVAAVENGELPLASLTTQQRNQFLKSKDAALRERAEKLFATATTSREQALEKAKAALSLSGNAAHGREQFRTLCASCHRLEREGVAVGPDLFDIRNQPKENILFHIVAPDAEVAPNFAGYLVELRDGRAFSGLLISETPTSLQLRMPGGQEETLLRRDIAKLEALPNSLMPAGLEAAMSTQQLADLLAFLKREK